MPPLRNHTKSRNGCDTCRERKVKCDETGPPCTNCSARQLECTYLKVAAARTRATDAPGRTRTPQPRESKLGSPSILPTTLGIEDLELMHKFSIDTYQSLCVSDAEIDIWKITIPRLALRHHYLMHGILALASMHFAASAEPSERLVYQGRALQYYDRSLGPFRHAMDNISPQNCDAVFAHSIIIIAISLASTRLTVAKDDVISITEKIVMLFELLQGVKNILQVGHSWINIDLFSHGAFWRDTTAELDPDTDAALAHLAALNEENMVGVYAQQYNINKEVISHLRHCFAKFALSADPAPVMAWLARVEKGFVDSLRYRQSFSLLILMYWGVLLNRLDGKRWWAQNSGKALVSELLPVLQSDSRLERALAWVKTQMDL